MKTKAKDFYTILEFAEYIGVCYRTILTGIKKGHIEAFRVGRGRKSHFRIPHSEIQRMGIFHLDEIIDKIVDQKFKDRDERNKTKTTDQEKEKVQENNSGIT
jgi:excisionase family DNA binding protein